MPSLLEALEKKYCLNCQYENANDDDTAGGTEERLISIFIPRLSPLISVPELLVLNDCDIDSAGDFESIKDKCQRVRELDLAQNKLQDWKEVSNILQHMPRIEFLNLSKNNLIGPITKFGAPSSISNLKSIVLNCTYLDWLCIKVLIENLPILEELHLSLNNYREVLIDTANDSDGANETCSCCESDETHATNCKNCRALRRCRKTTAHKILKTLHFTGNPIENWHDICRLGRVFPKLVNLVLADCPIKAIETNNYKADADKITTKTDEADTPYKYFPSLLFLNLSYTNINTWDDVDQLSMFPNLRNLRVKNWPLWERLECTEHERRQLLIARLPNVTILNGGGTITSDEREASERAFIRYYMEKPDWERPKRYDELIAKHGKLDPLVNVNLKPDKSVKVSLTYNDATETRLLNIYRSVADLKVRLEKMVGLPANKMRLYYLDKDYKEHGPEEMKYPNKLLYSYNIQEGDEIIIDEKK